MSDDAPPMPDRYAAMVGQEYGRVLVRRVERSKGKNREGRRYWNAFLECSCGWKFWAVATYVIKGETTRCFRCHAIYVERYGESPNV